MKLRFRNIATKKVEEYDHDLFVGTAGDVKRVYSDESSESGDMVDVISEEETIEAFVEVNGEIHVIAWEE